MAYRNWIAGVALLAASAAVADVTEEVNMSFSLKAGGRISLENINGDVTITGASGDAVTITALKKADSQDYLEGMEIKVDASDDLIRIDTEHPDKGGGFWNWGDEGGGSITYTLSVPSSANLDVIESVNGDVRISGVLGTVKAETVNGEIEASGLSGDVNLETVNGSVEAAFASLGGDQRVDCETVNGKITLSLPSSTSASFSAETVNGGIDGDDFGLATNKGFVGRDLSGKVGEGSARVNLSTVNGAIRIRKG